MHHSDMWSHIIEKTSLILVSRNSCLSIAQRPV